MTTARQLIDAAVPMLDGVTRMWVSSAQQKRLAKALRDGLNGPDGEKIAELVLPYYNPFSKEAVAEGPVSGGLELALIPPGDNLIAVFVSGPTEQSEGFGFNIDSSTKVTADGKPLSDLGALAAYIAGAGCTVSATVGGGGEEAAPTATSADFKSEAA